MRKTFVRLICSVMFALALQPQFAMAAGADLLWARGASDTNPNAAVRIPGSGLIAVASGPRIKIHRVSDGMLMREIEYGAYQLAASPNGQYLAAVGSSHSVEMFSVADGTVVRSFPWSPVPQGCNYVDAVDFSPDGSKIVGSVGWGNICGGIRVWQVSDGAVLLTETNMGRVVGERTYSVMGGYVRFSNDGNHLLTNSSDNASGATRVAAYRFTDGALLQLLLPSWRGATGWLEVSPTGSIFAIRGNLVEGDNVPGLMTFNLSQLCNVTETCLNPSVPTNLQAPLATTQFTLAGQPYSMGARSFVFSPDGSKLAVNGTTYISGTTQPGSETSVLYHAADGSMIRSMTGYPSITGSPSLPLFSEDSASLFMVAASIKQWDVASGTLVKELSISFYPAASTIAFSPDGASVATSTPYDYYSDYFTAATNCRIDLRSADTGAVQRTIELGVCVNPGVGSSYRRPEVAYLPDGKSVLSVHDKGDPDAVLNLWDAATGANIWGGVGVPDTTPLVMPRTGEVFLVGTQLHSLADGSLVHDLSSILYHFAGRAVFSGDGQRVGLTDGLGIRIVDVTTGTLLQNLLGSIAWLSQTGDIARTFSPTDIVTWRVSDQQQISSVALANASTATLGQIAVTPDGSRLLAHYSDGTLRIWRSSDGSLVELYDQGFGAPVTGFINPANMWVQSLATDDAGRRFAFMTFASTAAVANMPPSEPGAPVIGSAVAGDGQATISFAAPRNEGSSPVTGYTATSADPSAISASGSGSPITVTGLTNGTTYWFTVTAHNAVGISEPSAVSNSVTPSAPVTTTTETTTSSTAATTTTSTAAATTTTTTASTTTTTLAAGTSASLGSGWNLLGNGLSDAITVSSTFGDTNLVSTVWKWIASSSNWAFYTPGLGDGGAAYAAGKGYDFLTTINSGEGFWVNAKSPFSVQLSGSAVLTSRFADGVSSANNGLPAGWSLIATGEEQTPGQFANAIALDHPTTGTSVATSITTLWAWDAGLSNWYFYAPTLANAGTLSSYVLTKGYLDFGAEGKTLAPSTGFWVNKP